MADNVMRSFNMPEDVDARFADYCKSIGSNVSVELRRMVLERLDEDPERASERKANVRRAATTSQITVRISEDMREAFTALTRDQGVSPAELIRAFMLQCFMSEAPLTMTARDWRETVNHLHHEWVGKGRPVGVPSSPPIFYNMKPGRTRKHPKPERPTLDEHGHPIINHRGD